MPAIDVAAALTEKAAAFAPVVMQASSVLPTSFGPLPPSPIIQIEIHGAKLRSQELGHFGLEIARRNSLARSRNV